MKIVLKIPEIVFRVAYLVAVVLLIFGLCYLLGHGVLEGRMWGDDNAFAHSNLVWLARWFPKIPFWDPSQGAGQSLVAGYYVLPYYFVILLQRLSHLDLIQSLRLVEFLVIPTVALEIYLFVWARFKNQTMAALAALLYPLSSAAWSFFTQAGVFSFGFSIIWMIPTLLFFDLYLEAALKQNYSVKLRRVWFFFSVIFFALSLISHWSVGVTMILLLLIYAPVRSYFYLDHKRLLGALLKGWQIFLIAFGTSVLLAAFLLYPQIVYSRFANRYSVAVYGANDVYELKIPGFLGFVPFDNKVVPLFIMPFFLAASVSILALIGGFSSFLRRHWAIALVVPGALAVLFAANTRGLSSLSYYFQLLILPTGVRSLFATLWLAPILAAFGAVSLATLPMWVFDKLLFLVKIRWSALRKLVFNAGVAILAILIVAFVVYQYSSSQKWNIEGIGKYAGFGPFIENSLCYVPYLGRPQANCDNFKPKYQIDSIPKNPFYGSNLKEVETELGWDQFTRIDISPGSGILIAGISAYSDVSVLHSYAFVPSLIRDYWGYQKGAYYGREFGDAHQVDEMAKWFGINYVINNAGDPLEKFVPSSWKKVDDIAASNGTSLGEIRKFKEDTPMLSLATKPTILVISDNKKDGYEEIFKVAVMGSLDYDQALLVYGKQNIDDYSLSELQKNAVLVLQGYKYKNKTKAWKLLKDYVESGGNLFIDTGWQFVAKDWGKGEKGHYEEVELPEPSPVSKTTWGDIGSDWSGGQINEDITSSIDLSKFGSPTWRGAPWGASLASKEDLRDFAKPILTVNDKVLIAEGDFGKGKVIWSGMNLPTFVFEKKGEEVKFTKELFSLLLSTKKEQNFKAFVKRDYPDRLEFTFAEEIPENTSFYWREAYSPDWKAVLESGGKKQELKVGKAGPEMIYLSLPAVKEGSKLVLSYELKKKAIFGSLVSLVTLAALLLVLLDSLLLGGKYERMLRGKLDKPLGDFGRSIRHKIGLADEEGE